MKKLQVFTLLTILAVITTTSCNQIKNENRVLMQSKGDTLLVINLPSAGCDKCQKTIEGGLSDEKGVKQSILNLKTKNVSIVYDPLIISPEILKSTVTELSYKMPCKQN